MAKSDVKGWIVIPETAKRLQRELKGEKVFDFYGEHNFTKGQNAEWSENGSFGFFAINGISAERLVSLGVCTKELDAKEGTVKYEITRNCTVKVSHDGVEEYSVKGVKEFRNKTIYELV